MSTTAVPQGIGSTTTVLGIPGTLCAPSLFDPLAAHLDDAVPGVRFDAWSWMDGPGPWDIPTVAARSASRLREVVSQRGDDTPAVVIGHSTGGAVALELALSHPELVSALVLVNTGPNMHEHGDVGRILQTLHEEWSEGLRATILDRSFASPPPPDVREALLDYARSVSPDAVHDVLTSQRAIDFVPRLAELDCRVSVVHGIRDEVRTVAQARAFAAHLPGVDLTLIDCGHTPPFERPGEVAAVIARLLGVTSSPDRSSTS